MRIYIMVLIVAFIALIWYTCLSYAALQGSQVVVMLLMATPWCFMVCLWTHGNDQYDAGYRIGHAAGVLKASQKVGDNSGNQ